MAKLTKRVVDSTAADPTRRYTVWDSEIHGFGLQVLPSGIKSYVFQFRTSEGRSRRATLGRHGALTTEEARIAAEAMRRAVRAGDDPLEERRARREAATVGNLLDAYLASAAFAVKAPKTQDVDRGRVEGHLRPLLGGVAAQALTPDQVRRAIAAIAAGKTARPATKTGPRGVSRVRGGPGAARKSLRLVRTVLAWAVAEGLVATNPAESVKSGVDGTRSTILGGVADYGRLFAALDRMEAERRIRPAVADAIRLITLTGARRGEVRTMRWRDVDLRAGVVTLPPTRHKGGAKTGAARVIGLSSVAQALIARQPAGEPDGFVFAPSRGDRPLSLAKWAEVRVEAGLPATIGLHGLRHSAASHLAAAGATAPEVMTALGHRDLSSTQKYLHALTGAHRRLAERTAAPAMAGLALAAGDKDGEVVPLRGGK